MYKSRRKQKQSASGKLFGALFGLGLFAGSFFLLWSNEGRINYADIAVDSISVSANQSGLSYPGELLAVEGNLFTEDTTNDSDFFESTPYIQLNRIAEMYAWEEKEVTEDEETYYEYSSEWTETPENSSQFYDPNYFNPVMPYQSISFTVSTASVDLYEIDPASIQFPDPQLIDFSKENIREELLQVGIISLSNEYIYFGNFSVDAPEIGDLRISFTAIAPQNNSTTFGSIIDDQLVPYNFDGDESLYRLFFVDRENAILQMEEEYTAALWGARFAGFALMWCGMFLLLNPITILVTFLPILERAGFWLLILLTLPVAVIISALLITASYFAHNPLVLLGLILLSVIVVGGIMGGLYLFDKNKKEASS